MSLYGDSDDVEYLMKMLSHRSRAYFVNAGKLKGFLVPGLDFAAIFDKAREDE